MLVIPTGATSGSVVEGSLDCGRGATSARDDSEEDRYVITRLAFATALLLIITTPLLAQIPSGEGWRELESENFIVFSNLDQAAAAEIGLDLERLRAVLEVIFPDADFESPLDTLIYIFRDPDSFGPYALPGGQAGYFVPHRHANFAAVIGSDPGAALPVVYRQYLHDLISHNVPQVPLWFRHGLAEIFSTFEADGSTAQVALAPSGADGLAMVGSQRMPVGEVLAMEELPNDPVESDAFVRGAWALTHYLMVDDEARFAATRRFVRALEENPTAGQSITDALGVDEGALEASVAAYVGGEALPHREVPVPGNVPSEVSLTPLDAHVALFHLGDLLIHSNPARQTDAQGHFEASLAAAPDFAPSTAGLGLVAEMAGDRATAEARYGEALTARPEAFRLQVLAGENELALLGKRRPQTPEEQERLDRAIAAFRATTELRPGYGEGWALLGYAYNLEAKPSPDALATLERAYEMLPGRGDVAFNLLLGYARGGERQKAIDLVATAEARGVAEEQLAPARQILLQLDFQYAVALAREGKYDEAAPLLEAVAADAADAGLKQRASELLGQISG